MSEKILTQHQRAVAGLGIQERFVLDDAEWTRLHESPLYPRVFDAAHHGHWQVVAVLLGEIARGEDR